MKLFLNLSITLFLLFGSALAQDGQPTVRHKEMRFDLPADGEGMSSPIKVPLDAPEPFLAVSAIWTGNEQTLIRLRGSMDGLTWDGWQQVIVDHDSMTRRGESVGSLMLFDAQTKLIQYQVEGNAKSLRLRFISPGATPRERSEKSMSEENQPQPNKYPKPSVTTRTEWGCPDGQVTTHGNLSYTTVTHLIVHHTFIPSTAPNGDWAALVRGIWNSHIFSNGWADIGYNYLIDPNGVIYEGRAGGDNVQGAHFSGVNGNTMGVAFIGDFTNAPPTAAALSSLKKILSWKADQRDLDPTVQSRHAASGLTLFAISGHRDGPGSTECPGSKLYALLPTIRTEVKALFSTVGTIASVSAASFDATALATESIAALFGNNLATTTLVAEGASLPTALGGVRVTVRDSVGNEKLAPLFFISAGQINFLMPSGLSAGQATILVTNNEGNISRGTVTLTTVAPALFAANANGKEAAAAVVLRVKPNGTQSYEPTTIFDAIQNRFVTTPIDLSTEGDQVFLIAYGTGLRFRSVLSAITAKLGGTNAEVLFAGETPGFFGLDQVNIRLPRSLAGRGEVDFELTADGRAANVLKLRIK